MKIMILANNDGGLWNFRRELIRALVRNNEVWVCVPEGPFVNDIAGLGCTYVPCGVLDRRSTNPVKDLKLIRFYLRELKAVRPDVVLSYTIKPNVYGGIVCSLLKIPYLANITGLGTTIENGGLLSRISLTLYKTGLRKASCVFFQNDDNRRLFVRKGIVKGKTRLIPGSGVNIDVHKTEPYPSDADGIRFLFVGRIMKDKGIEELLSAILKIHQERKDVVLDVVGQCDEDYSSALEKAGKAGALVYHGLQKDVHPFYAGCHAAVLPSYHEGMANVLLEASATGRPVIATRVPGCWETYDEGVTGFGCEVRDAADLRRAMEHFLDLTNEERAAMGRAARAKMEKQFDRNLVTGAYKEELNVVFKKKKRG